MTFREQMIQDGGNIGWCIPYFDASGKYALAVNEGEIAGAVINGVDIPAAQLDQPETIHSIAVAVNSDYNEYSGYDDLYIALESMTEGNCCDCPWFTICEAMEEI